MADSTKPATLEDTGSGDTLSLDIVKFGARNPATALQLDKPTLQALLDGRTETLTQDPVVFVPGKMYWINTPAVPTTQLSGSIVVFNGIGEFQVSVNSALESDRKFFGDSGGHGDWGLVTFTLNEQHGPSTQAWGFWDFSANPTDGDNIGWVFQGTLVKSIVFQNSPTSSDNVQIGGTLDETIDNLVAKIQSFGTDLSAICSKESSTSVRMTVGTSYFGAASNNKVELAVWVGNARITTSHLAIGGSSLSGGADGPIIPEPVVITPTPPGAGNLNISFGADKTWNDVVSGFIAWADATLSAPGLLDCHLTQPADGTLTPQWNQMSVYLNTNGSQEIMTVKVQSLFISWVFSGQLY